MLKKILIGVGIFIGITIVAIGLLVWYFYPKAEKVAQYITKHPETTSIVLVRNGERAIERNPQKAFPLASTMKIIVLIEYAEQAAKGLLDPKERIPIPDIDVFYVPNTDGGAHKAWKEGEGIGDSPTIREIAGGMIKYSSNANTEWLMERLGLDNINTRLDSLGLSDHGRLFYIVSSLYVGKEAFGADGKDIADRLRKMNMDEYIDWTYKVHERIKSDPEYRKELGDLGLNVQRAWTEKLTFSTATEYARLMGMINNCDFITEDSIGTIDSTAQRLIEEAMGHPMDNPANQEWLKRAGMKGGSTMFLLTKALYAEKKDSSKTELAYFLTDLKPLKMMQLGASMNAFELAILQGKDMGLTD